MKKTTAKLRYGLICLTIVLIFSSNLFALTNRPSKPSEDYPHDSQGNFVPQPFAEGDAIRYGGLFGPLPEPYGFGEGPSLFQEIAKEAEQNINTRDIGFEAEPDHFVPVARTIEVD